MVDLEAINKYLDIEDTKYKEVNIDNQLRNKILCNIPNNLSDLEKAIYIYIKMCKILTYDEEYYAVNQKGEAALKHMDISYVSNINPTNNSVVCFEFNLIYSKLLSELGINFKSDYKNMVGENYGFGHANLEFRSGKFIVKADSVTSILLGDIMQAKLNQPLSGLVCMNNNIKTRVEFRNTLKNVYSLIAKEDSISNEVGHVQTLMELLEEYNMVNDYMSDISLDERLFVIISKVNSYNFVGIDSLSYLIQLTKTLFTKEQRSHNISLNIVRNNDSFDRNKIASASAVIVMNPKDFNTYSELNTYYYFNPNSSLVMIDKYDLQERFDTFDFEYISIDDPKIPGIIDTNSSIKLLKVKE